VSAKKSLSLSQWIWRAFVQSALIPLVLVEAVLITIYLLSNSAIRDAQIEHLRQTALNDLQASAGLETRIVEGQLSQIEALTNAYRNMTQRALQQPANVTQELAVTSSGVRYSAQDNGGAAFFYSAVTPLDRQELDKVARLATLEPLMAELKQSSPLVASLYFNSWDSLNHIYPWFLTPDQYPHDMVIPDYNFYYLADAAHNPQRRVVWTDVYLDPAGQGWMMSAIAPVYRGDFLEGVTGVDITVGGILSQIDQLQVPWDGYAMLVSQNLNIMALPKAGEDDFGLSELTQHSYQEAIRREIFKPEDFNLSKREQTRALATAMAQQPQGVQSVMLGGRAHLLAWATIEGTGWKLLAVVDEAQVFSQTNFLARHYQQIGYLLIAGLVLFYLLFFAFMWVRSRRLSQHLLKPIAGISTMMAAIGQGQWRPKRVNADIRELDDMAGQAAQMGYTLEQSEARNQVANEAKSRFISSMSHELRTPLNAIQGFAQLIRMGDLPAPTQDEYLEEILQASLHLNQLVGDILDWSSIQAQKPQLELQAVDVGTLMSECADLVRLEIKRHGLQFNLDLPATPLQVRAEPRRLRQVLLNLLSNAMKYNSSNGQISFGYQLLDGHVRLLVEDTGLGISAAQQELLFKPFQRLGRENTAIQGTGIGLSLCREYANLMDATVGVRSEPGVGSSFWIELLLYAASDGVQPTDQRLQIVYADSDGASQQAVAAALADLAQVRLVSDAQTTLEQLSSAPPALLLLDVQLPGLSAQELLKQVRRHPRNEALPVVLLTHGMTAEVAAAAVNCQGLLGKPLDLEELHGLVEALLSEVTDDAE